MEEITPKIFREVERIYGNNIYYIDDKKKIQIDAALILDRPVDLLVLTHSHFDHISKAAEIKQQNPNVVIAASKEAAKHIENMDEVVIKPVKKFKVDLVLDEGSEIGTGQFNFKVLKVPGHTDGSIALYEPAKKILFSGDCWFGGEATGRWDYPSGNLEELKRSVKRLKELKPKLLCQGHSY